MKFCKSWHAHDNYSHSNGYSYRATPTVQSWRPVTRTSVAGYLAKDTFVKRLNLGTAPGSRIKPRTFRSQNEHFNHLFTVTGLSSEMVLHDLWSWISNINKEGGRLFPLYLHDSKVFVNESHSKIRIGCYVMLHYEHKKLGFMFDCFIITKYIIPISGFEIRIRFCWYLSRNKLLTVRIASLKYTVSMHESVIFIAEKIKVEYQFPCTKTTEKRIW